MADSGDEQGAGQPPTEGAEETIDSIAAAEERDLMEPPGDDEAEDGLVEEVMKAISASSSPQPGELPETDFKQPEIDSVDPAETQESSEGVPQNGEEEALPSDPPASEDPPPETTALPQQSEAELQEKEVENPVEEQEAPEQEAPEQEEEQEKSMGEGHEAGPHWLSAEEVRAKGLAEDSLNKYRRFHLKQAFSVDRWYELIKQCTFETQFLPLSTEQVEALLACHHLANPTITDEHKEVLSALEEKLNETISKFGEDGVVLKLNAQGVMDVILDQSDPDHITGIQNDIVTEVEVDRQTSNAYLIWRSWRSASFRRSATSVGLTPPTGTRENIMRRSFRRIQRTWQRPASAAPATKSTTEAEGVALAEDSAKAGEEQPKPAEDDDHAQSTKITGDQDKGGATAVEVTAEVTVEASAKEEESGEEMAKAASAREPLATDVTNEAAKPDNDGNKEPVTVTQKEPNEDSEPQQGSEGNEGCRPTDTKEPAVTAAGEPKEGVSEPQQSSEGKKEDQPIVEETPKKEQIEPKSKPERVHGWGEQGMSHLKEEPMNNRVLRAFKRVVAARLRVTSGSQAINKLLRSAKIHQLLTEWKEFSAVEGETVCLSLRRWNAQIPRYPDMIFRAFVFKNKLTALTQYDHTCFTPNIARFKSTIEKKIKMSFLDNVQEPLGEYQNYTVDFFVSPNKVLVVDIGPFQSGEHSGLFCWITHHKQLTSSTPVQFKVISNARKGDIFADLPSNWKQVCENVTQQKAGLEARNRKCVIL